MSTACTSSTMASPTSQYSSMCTPWKTRPVGAPGTGAAEADMTRQKPCSYFSWRATSAGAFVILMSLVASTATPSVGCSVVAVALARTAAASML